MAASKCPVRKLVATNVSVALAVLCSFSSAPLTAQTAANWQAGSGFWSSPSNWDCGQGFPGGCVPNINTAATIGNGGTANLDINASVQSLLVSAGGVVISGGLSLSSGNSFIGLQGGTATVTGPGSQWNSTYLAVGYEGQGTLTIQSGGVVTTTGNFDIATYGGSGKRYSRRPRV